MSSEGLLHEYKDEPSRWRDEYDQERISAIKEARWPRRILFVICTLLGCSLLSNVALFHQMRLYQQRPGSERTIFSGLPYDTPMEYKSSTAWGSTNESIADPVWESVDSSPIVVALSDEYAREKGLALSMRFPWDDTKGIYHIKAFHHMHCLKNIRKAFIDLHFGREPIIPYAHFMHCLDSLRQDVVCTADDTPMPTIEKKHHIGDGQVLQCRSWDRLIAWTQEPERQSCYHMIDDYHTVHHTLEEFDDCPAGSQYEETAREYFEQWGHKDPFGA